MRLSLLLLIVCFSSPLLSQSIEADTDIISLYEDGGRYLVSKSNRDTSITIQLSADSLITSSVAAYRRHLATASDSIDLHQLYTLLLLPLEPLQQHLVIYRSGAFAGLPIAGLVKKSTLKHESYKQHHYLIEAHTITYQINEETWLRALEQPVRGSGTALILPDESDTEGRYLHEVRDIRDDFGGEVIDIAITDDIAATARDRRLVHIAGGASIKDQSLMVGDKALPLQAEQVTISELDNTDDLWIRRLLHDGVKAVLYCPDHDHQSARRQIITRYYRQLFDGDRKQDALRTAQLRYLGNSGQAEAHPAYWSTWQLYGDVKSIDGNVPSKLYWVLIAVMILLLVVLRRSGGRLF